MAQIRFEDIKDVGLNSGNQNKVGFFSLKNDGDEAIVRIMHDSTDSFEIVSTHQIEVNGKFRRINCCRSPYDPIENCPICAIGKNVQSRFFIHLIQYTIGEGGMVVCEPKVWERPASFANTIKNLITNYGPLSNSIFKVKRNGAARSTDTTYDLMYMPPQQYPEAIYKKVTDAFDGYSVIGTIVMDKRPADIIAFLQTGNFPMPKKEANATIDAHKLIPASPVDVTNVTPSAPVSGPTTPPWNGTAPAPNAYFPPQGGYVENQQSVNTNVGPTQPMPTIDRPVRYY